MTHSLSLPVADRDDYPVSESDELTYEQWLDKLRVIFKDQIKQGKDYSAQERDELIRKFEVSYVINDLRSHIGIEENFSQKIMDIKEILLQYFDDVVLNTQRQAEEAIAKIIAMRQCEDHVASHPHFYAAEGID